MFGEFGLIWDSIFIVFCINEVLFEINNFFGIIKEEDNGGRLKRVYLVFDIIWSRESEL